jgi:hypothetical protein
MLTGDFENILRPLKNSRLTASPVAIQCLVALAKRWTPGFVRADGPRRYGRASSLCWRSTNRCPVTFLRSTWPNCIADLGDQDLAFESLELAYKKHDIWLVGLRTDFALDSLRSDPRYAELVRKIGFPQ